MILSRIYPGTTEVIDLDDASSRDTLRDWYQPTGMSVVRMNLITTIDGSVGGTDGTSHTLSNPADRRILGVIRELADVVLVGASSVRREGYLLPRHARLAVVTGSGDLTGHGFGTDVEPGRLVVLCAAASVGRLMETLGGVPAEIVTLPLTDGALSMTDVITALRIRGMESIVCEGGPSLASQLLAADLVDELCLSTSPVIGGSDQQLLPAGVAVDRRATLTQLIVDDASGLYARWRMGGEPTAAPPAIE